MSQETSFVPFYAALLLLTTTTGRLRTEVMSRVFVVKRVIDFFLVLSNLGGISPEY